MFFISNLICKCFNSSKRNKVEKNHLRSQLVFDRMSAVFSELIASEVMGIHDIHLNVQENLKQTYYKYVSNSALYSVFLMDLYT